MNFQWGGVEDQANKRVYSGATHLELLSIRNEINTLGTAKKCSKKIQIFCFEHVFVVPNILFPVSSYWGVSRLRSVFQFLVYFLLVHYASEKIEVFIFLTTLCPESLEMYL